mgnify:CR=1 FL=1
MNFHDRVQRIIETKNSLLCVGLDSVIENMPKHIQSSENPLWEFNKAIIDTTLPHAAAFKVNLAFYEAYGLLGWNALEKTFNYMPNDVLAIADAKRGDIGNTARMYARAVFEQLDADAVTVNPYLGKDSAEPFLQDESKGVFFLCLTSNPGSQDFQYFSDGQTTLYELIANTVNSWNQKKNCGLVVGATHPDELKRVRNLCPDLPFLIPGISPRSCDLLTSDVKNTDASGSLALFNSSRAILYARQDENFETAAAQVARETQQQLNEARTLAGRS